ncbi:hypothetical protein A3H90_01080 [Candidatus Peribacteria bacterium RIFCSPLOWO2_02_FULL_55_36]|nr:MAG: hypothetical protein A2789_03855 [Candidatus Peribacteria bacterium RIFCSPHIGHO2_01_FULL_54_22]OGJ63190.1 MAG: hypothetical protein A3D12_03525 [Candidatus Peribacteria bacterium RIFCSPHIGHO2_02_FULL_55_24]OGJ64189.1 MAG: hypothetical protein A3E47_03925 [Candidatus Peribacteria bacterium RIFCSPHIGHO2_12_FULL_54_10]OGJ69147.1 MAG: hypothetical protein A3H90_01080 [Candidatus Peribacteria bacterium RIFCSPLOWO2_02_FULL_55_36]
MTPPSRHPRFIVFTGGVCSSLGKGIAASAIGAIMKACGLKVFVQKIDPYLNIDPGTMSPFQHGEVFVTNDGAETDLDLGHYERFIDEPMSRLSTVTAGQIYQDTINRERRGDFLGGTIQVVPHITNAIKQKIAQAAEAMGADILMVEIGGTVGDIESPAFLEAVRQLRSELEPGRLFHIHLTLLPYLKGSKELKTKPTQHSVQELHRHGIQPDMILARADYPIPDDLLDKISRFCDVPREAVLPAQTLHSIYDVPLHLEKYGIARIIGDKLGLGTLAPNMTEWEEGRLRHDAAKKVIRIALVGKYTGLEDAYLSVIEAIKSAAVKNGRKAEILWIDSEKLEEKDEETWAIMRNANGIVVPGGFGSRGIEGKIAAIRYARTKKIPYLGLCLGGQLLAIEFARAALKDPALTSEEFDEKGAIQKSKYVVHFLPGQAKGTKKGGTLRLGAYPCSIVPHTKAWQAYQSPPPAIRPRAHGRGTGEGYPPVPISGTDRAGGEGPFMVSERHRHRYEFNNAFQKRLEAKGLIFSGIWEETNLAEIVELKDHPFMLGTQFHPEFQSRPHRPHPLFEAFLKAAIEHS